MASNWTTLKLGDVTKWSSGGTPKKSEPSYWGGDIPWISASSMDGHLYTESKLKITEEGLENGTRLAPENSILLLVRGSILHQKMQVGLTTRAVAFNQDVKCLIANEDYLDPWYLLLWFKAKEQELLAIVESTGIGAGKFDTKLLSEYPIEIPPQEEREKIKNFGKALFDKTTNIAKTNQTLEQMAQALFKSWFVDFDPVFDNALASGMSVNDFPEALQKKALSRQQQRQQVQQQTATGEPSADKKAEANPLPEDISQLFPSEFEQTHVPSIGINGWIPKGWKPSSFESLIKLIGGGTPKTTIEEYWNGDIPWFSVVDAPNDSDVFVLDTEKHVTQLGIDKSSTKILRSGTTIISARGTVGKCALVAEPMAMNQSCYGINGIDGVSDEFIYFMTRHQVSDLQKRGHGSVFNTITRETFKSILLPFSGDEVTQKFSEVVTPLLNKVLLNNKQNAELIKTRDVLLPKLISGEISINSIQ